MDSTYGYVIGSAVVASCDAVWMDLRNKCQPYGGSTDVQYTTYDRVTSSGTASQRIDSGTETCAAQKNPNPGEAYLCMGGSE